jgi:hypothetical protein
VPLFFKWLERGKQLIPAGLEEHHPHHGKKHKKHPDEPASGHSPDAPANPEDDHAQ